MYPRRRVSRGIVIMAAISLIVGLLFFIDIKFKQSIVQLSKSQVQLEGSQRISRIVEEEITSTIKYDDLVIIHKDNQGKIVLLQPNTVAISGIIARTVETVSRELQSMKGADIGVPLGQLSGSTLLASRGPDIKVGIIPSSQVDVQLINRFEQAGINQTRHLLYLNLNTKMKIAVPYIEDEVLINTTIPLAETIIVGPVPENYINFRHLDNELKR